MTRPSFAPTTTNHPTVLVVRNINISREKQRNTDITDNIEISQVTNLLGKIKNYPTQVVRALFSMLLIG